MNLSQNDIQRIKAIKKMFFDNAYHLCIGHLPSALSSIEILYTLYNKIADINNQNKTAALRDRIIISKEHCRFAQACVLTEAGLLDQKVIASYMQNGGLLGHDMYNIVGSKEIAAVDVSSGSLGHGLSVGSGLSWGGGGTACFRSSWRWRITGRQQLGSSYVYRTTQNE